MQLRNEQYKQLYSIYNETQLRNERIQQARRREIQHKIPAYEALNHRLAELSVEMVRAKLEDGTGNLATFQAEVEEITRRKEQLLIEHGYPANYTDRIYTCSDCQDTGYIDDEKCHCFQSRIVEYLYEQSNLKEVLEHENFSHFCIDYYPDDFVEETTGLTPRDNSRKILHTAQFFAEHFTETHDNLLLYGNTGVGKTFLSHCIAKEALDQSHTVVYLTSLGLFDILEKNKFDRSTHTEEKSATVSYILNCDLLIIDDLGTELNNSFTSSQLYQVLDTRLVHQKSTIISTNLSFDDLREQYSERIFSRITSGYTLLKVTGDDIRLKKAISARQSKRNSQA